MKCNRCEGTGFINLHQLDLSEFEVAEDWHGAILDWLYEQESARMRLGGCQCPLGHPPCSYCLLLTDVEVCDCCGDGRGDWHGEPGEHAPGEPCECG